MSAAQAREAFEEVTYELSVELGQAGLSIVIEHQHCVDHFV